MTGRRVAVLARFQLRSFFRDPRNLLLLAVLPLFVVEGFGQAMATFPQPPGMATAPSASGKAIGVAFSTAFLAGVFSLYQAMSATAADGRSVVAGLAPGTLLAARGLSILVVDAAIAALNYAVFAWSVTPVRPGIGYLSLLLGAILYSLIGLVVGSVLSGLFEGSIAILFLADLDAFLGSGMASVDAARELFPLYYPSQLFRAAVFDGSVTLSLVPPAVVYLAVLSVAASLPLRYRVFSGR